MPMNPRLLRPRSTVHPEAADWANRVRANGGSVSGSTLNAVSRFCASMTASGIRDRFFRLNLFCGNSLSAALVPLFSGQSLGGTQYGNTTDTNNNFVSNDYNETGSSAGLYPGSSNTSKYLDTGFPANTVAAGSAHLGLGMLAANTLATGTRTAIGAYNTGNNSFELNLRNTVGATQACCWFTRFGTSTDTFGDNTGTGGSILAAGNIVASWPTMYRNGSASGTTATTSQNYPAAHPFYVFAASMNTTPFVLNYSNPRLGWYSIGASMTASQVVSFNNAIVAFNTALSRT